MIYVRLNPRSRRLLQMMATCLRGDETGLRRIVLNRCGLAMLCWLGFVTPAAGLDPQHGLTQYVHRIWQTEPGLPQTTIFTVRQTRDGYLWLGTESGIVRFDGVRFARAPGLDQAAFDDIRARSFAEDSLGRLWIMSSNLGVVRLAGETATIVKIPDGLPPGDIGCLFADHAGSIWICTSKGVAKFEGDRLLQYGKTLPNRPVVGCESPDRKIWIAGEGWFGSLTGRDFAVTRFHADPEGDGIRAMVCRDDGLWVGTKRGLLHSRGTSETLYTKARGLPENAIFSLATGSSGELWIGTSNGLSRFFDGRFDSFNYTDGLSQKDVNSIYEDREGSLWVATKYGLNQFLDGPVARFTRHEGLPSSNVGPVLEDRSGALWVGFLDAGLARWDGRKITRVPGLETQRVNSLLESANGSLWIATDQGLWRIESGRIAERFDIQSGLPSLGIHSLLEDQSGAIWVGTDKGPVVLQAGRFVRPPGIGAEMVAPVLGIAETKDRRKLFAMEDGSVLVLQGASLGPLASGDKQNANVRNIISIYSDRDGLVWMGTNGFGLWLLRDGKITRIFRTDGMFDGEIYGFASDARGLLWMVCSKGFFSVPKTDLLAFADGKLKKIKSSPYIPLEGARAIQGRPGVQQGALAAHDGTLWFTTLEGLVQYAPQMTAKDNPAPPVLIEDVTVGGVRVHQSNPLAIGPGKQNVAFRYTGLSFIAPQSMSFKYRLDGYDHDWTDAGTRREAFYTNLPAGRFQFHVTACAPFVPCNDVGSTVTFEVASYIYQRVWFWPLTVLLLTSLIWLAHRLKIARLKSEFSIVMAERTRIARELHDTLIQGFSGITMQMQALAERLVPSKDKHVLEEIVRDAGACLNETRQSVAGLRAGEEASPELAEAIAGVVRNIAEEHNLTLVLQMDDTPQRIPAGIRYNLVRIAQEAAVNSAKHSGATTLEVVLAYTRDELRLSISDNGRGMPLFGGEVRAEPNHYGIIGMKERAEHIGAEFHLNSSPESGTTVSVRIQTNERIDHAHQRGKMETAL